MDADEAPAKPGHLAGGPLLATVELADLVVRGRHGVLAHERECEQDFSVSVRAVVEVGLAVAGDDIEHALDYSRLAQLVTGIVADRSFFLIETLCSEIASAIMSNFAPRSLWVKVKKLRPPMDANVSWAAVEMSWGLGAQGERAPQ